MKKIILLMMSILVLTGCLGMDGSNGDMVSVSILITVEQGDEVLVDDEKDVEENAILLDVLEEYYQVDTTPEGFITEIEGYSQDDSTFWIYEVNQEEVFEGAGDFELSEGDHVHFELSEWEG